MRGKGKSCHDLLDDEKLSHVPAVEASELKRKHDLSEVVKNIYLYEWILFCVLQL